MAEYTSLDSDDVKALLNTYSLGELRAFAPIKGGLANSSYKVTTPQGEFILSVCDEKDRDQVDGLTNILIYLEENDFPTSRLVKTREGDRLILRDETPVYVKKYMVGEVRRPLTASMLVQVGERLATLHGLSPLQGMPPAFPYGLGAFDELNSLDLDHLYIPWIQEKKDFLEDNIDPAMPKGFIHGDLFWDNLLFSGEKLVAVLDFEEACHYYRLFDLGMCAVGCCAKEGHFDMEKVAALVEGYHRLQPLQRAEILQLKIFMEYAAVAASFWRFRQYNVRYPQTDMAHSHEELSSLADHIHGMNQADFAASHPMIAYFLSDPQ